jgi:hypothetical protein
VDIGTSTALHWAARKGHLGVATVLVSEGATVLKKTKKGKTASDLAKENGHYNVGNRCSLVHPRATPHHTTRTRALTHAHTHTHTMLMMMGRYG